ncbi:ribonuclease H-like domain-containing protein [Mycena sp. CBHHK59/15]|nr:ribonuclease H-like domain-containing protein [Mycena sp. CBHHK59/15]
MEYIVPQICTIGFYFDDEVVIIDLIVIGLFPLQLQCILRDPLILKVGVGLHNDANLLALATCPYLLPAAVSLKAYTELSLVELTGSFMHSVVDKELQTSDWRGTITPEMIKYAAIDVELVARLYPMLLGTLQATEAADGVLRHKFYYKYNFIDGHKIGIHPRAADGQSMKWKPCPWWREGLFWRKF